MSSDRVFSNQSRTLRWRIAIAGVTAADLQQASREDPIMIRGTDIGVTHEADGPMVHFCWSHWEADGIEKINGPELTRPHVEFRCPIPQPGVEYAVDAELYLDFDAQLVLVITHFSGGAPIPASKKFVYDNVLEAQMIEAPALEHEPILS